MIPKRTLMSSLYTARRAAGLCVAGCGRPSKRFARCRVCREAKNITRRRDEVRLKPRP